MSLQGELTLVIEGASPIASEASAEDVRELMSSGESTSSAAKLVSKQLGVRRKQAYAAALDVQNAKP